MTPFHNGSEEVECTQKRIIMMATTMGILKKLGGAILEVALNELVGNARAR